jgi:cation-transporting ATPase V/Cu+-exporting ATPase
MGDSATEEQVRELRLDVLGMTCGSCAARVEKTLNKQQGVQASVNFATGEALLRLREDAPAFDALRLAVQARGYDVRVHVDEAELAARRDERAWLIRLVVAWPLAILTMVLSMAFMDETWARWTVFALATPVQFYAGWPFLKGAAIRARRLDANMDTLIAVGTLAAYLYSVWALTGMEDLYFDTSAVIIAFISLGRWLGRRAGLPRRSSGSSRSGPRMPASCATARSCGCPSTRCRSGGPSRCCRGRRSPWTGGWWRAPPPSTSRC